MLSKKWITICLLLLLASQQLSAQTGRELTGKVVDEAREAIVGAVVTCTSGNDTIQAATTTDADGRFSISVGGDSVCIEFSHLTYETHRLVTDARGGDMGEVVLAEKENRLDEVVVTTEYLKRKGTGMTVLVRHNPLAKERNMLQFMNTLPGVNGLSVNGKAPSLLFVNGREMKLPPSELLQYLAGLRAEDVQSVRILPSGGAKYSAENKGGVILIQLRNDKERLFSGSITLPLTVNTDNGHVSSNIPLTLNYTDKKIASYTYVSGNYLQKEQS